MAVAPDMTNNQKGLMRALKDVYLKRLKKAYDDGKITLEEYIEKKKF